MKNQIFLTMDSLRWDVFDSIPNLIMKRYQYSRAYTHGTYTLPAHTAFFTGKLPCTYKGIFDTCARSARTISGKPQWRLMNPESDGPAIVKVNGVDIIDGFNKLGYKTIGTGAVNWFNKNKPAHIPAIDSFTNYQWFGQYTQAVKQIDFVLKEIKSSNQPYFAFINFGETHHSYKINPADPPTAYGNFERCFKAQRRCLVFLDNMIAHLLDEVSNVDIIICSDHGDCFGENGLWGHSFFHEKIIEVPIIKLSKA